MPYFWLSFADPMKPEGEQFLGATMVEGEDLEDAVRNAWKLQINPGGEVGFALVPEDLVPDYLKYKDRLVSKLELNSDGEFSDRDRSRFQ